MEAPTLQFPAFRSRVNAYHAWRAAQGTRVLVVLAFAWAGVMGLLAQVRVPLPFTPVPFTMQVFGVVLGAVLLGTRGGALAQAAYVGAGVAGVPWFQGAQGGLSYALGVTGGYIAALPLASIIVSESVRRLARPTVPRLVVVMLAGIAVIYALGATWLALVLDVSLARAVALGVLPFVGLDVAKAVVAAALARALVPDAFTPS